MNGCQVIMLRKSLSADEEQHPFWSGTYQSRTHNGLEHLYLTERQARMMEGKQVLVLDDVSKHRQDPYCHPQRIRKCKRAGFSSLLFLMKIVKKTNGWQPCLRIIS